MPRPIILARKTVVFCGEPIIHPTSPDSRQGRRFLTHQSMDWFKGKSTGNHGF
jgi:hypothetical protein